MKGADTIWCCPRCRGDLLERVAGLECAGCGAPYDVVDGIPDLRVPGAVWIDMEQDLATARQLVSETEGLPLEDVVRWVYARRPGWDTARIELRTRQVLDAPGRLRGELDDWLQPCTVSGQIFLDLGCGPGMLLAAAAGRDGVGIGVDVSLVWLVVAKRLIEAHGGTPVLAAGLAEALPLRNRAVNGVVGLDVIEHVGDPVPVLQEVDRVTAADGWLALATPNRFSLSAEPHVSIWGVGWLPRRWQASYVRWRSGLPYEFTRMLSPREAGRLLRSHTDFRCAMQVPLIPATEIDRFSTRRSLLARTYNRLVRLRLLNPALLRLGPFFRIVGTKATP